MNDAVEVTEKVVRKWAKVGIVLNAEEKKYLFKSVLAFIDYGFRDDKLLAASATMALTCAEIYGKEA